MFSHCHIKYTVHVCIWWITVIVWFDHRLAATQNAFFYLYFLTLGRQTKSHFNLNSRDLALDPALTRDSAALHMTLWPLWHHLSSNLIPCVLWKAFEGNWMDLPLHLYCQAIQSRSGLSMVCRAPSWMRWATSHDGHRKALNSSTQTQTVFLKNGRVAV